MRWVSNIRNTSTRREEWAKISRLRVPNPLKPHRLPTTNFPSSPTIIYYDKPYSIKIFNNDQCTKSTFTNNNSWILSGKTTISLIMSNCNSDKKSSTNLNKTNHPSVKMLNKPSWKNYVTPSLPNISKIITITIPCLSSRPKPTITLIIFLLKKWNQCFMSNKKKTSRSLKLLFDQLCQEAVSLKEGHKLQFKQMTISQFWI